MAVSGTDAYGAYLDTGIGTPPAVRANTEIEVHLPGEIDTGSKNSVTTTTNSHIPHRHPSSTR